MLGVRNRWQYTRARSLFSKNFKISSTWETLKGRKLLLSCLEMLLFITSCQITMSVFSERSIESKFCTNFFGFFVFTLRLGPESREFFLHKFFGFQGLKCQGHGQRNLPLKCIPLGFFQKEITGNFRKSDRKDFCTFLEGGKCYLMIFFGLQ